MSRQLKISLLRAERQGEAGYEAAKGDVNRPDRHLFKQAATELGTAIEWGGDWKTLKDGPHFQLKR
ncbi:TPA: M15 family metallopeptidase [Escherichia coli]